MSSTKKPFRFHAASGCFIAERPVTPDEIVAKAMCITAARCKRGTHLTSPALCGDFLATHLSELEREVFACIFLDNRHRVISFETLFYGTIDGASVHPREVVKRALALNAAAVILTHNHPSGVAEPSAADHAITKRLIDSLGLVDIRVLDHILVASGVTVSFAERGLL